MRKDVHHIPDRTINIYISSAIRVCDNMLPPIWTIMLVVGLALLVTYVLMMLGTAVLGMMAILWVVGLILFGIGLIQSPIAILDYLPLETSVLASVVL